MAETTTKKDLILAEQVRLLFAAMPASASATLINATILVFAQWHVIERRWLSVWLAGHILVIAFRLYLAYRYKCTRPPAEYSSRWQFLFNGGVIFSALFWGAACLFLFPTQSIVHQVFLAFVIAGMCAGAASTLSFLRTPIFCFLAICLLPLIWRFLSGDTEISIAMGVMVLLFFIITMGSAARAYENILSNITLRLEADQRERALYESEARYKHIFESAPLGIMHYDQAGCILKCNARLGEMIGCGPDQLVGTKLFDAVSDNLLIDAIKRSLVGDSGFFQGTSAQLHPGLETPIRAYFQGITQARGTVVGGVAVVEDITEDQRIERLKSEFISTVSHELRTPLTAIIGSLSLLKSGGLTEQDKIQNLLANAHRNSERLLMLINDILDMEKISAGKMEYDKTEIPIMAFIDHAIQHNAGYGNRHQVSFEITQRIADDLGMFGDPLRLMQVMSNLLSNAVKFSPENSVVEIGVSHDQSMTTIAICDHGPGIPATFRDRVFERFSQADASSIRKTGGTGLGLSISRAIVTHHGGHIWFETKSGNGTCFYFTVPLASTNGAVS